MDPTTLTIGGLAALAAFNGMQWYFASKDQSRLHDIALDAQAQSNMAWDLLTERDIRHNSLRNSCFITNERGHRVRYVNASQEARAKAEGGV